MTIQPIQPNKPQPTFGNIYKETIKTRYGKCIFGNSRGYDYSVYIQQDKRTGNIESKLYYVAKNNKWVKSFLRFFSNNKVYKEIRSYGK